MSTDVATAKAEKKELTIKQTLAAPWFQNQMAMVLPKHCTAERMARVAITALTREPKLAECNQHSFFRCMLDLSAMGLEPDGRRAHLIPFGKECTLIVDYKGYAELAYRSGAVHKLHADVVRRGDVLVYDTGEVVKHIPWFLRTDDAKPEKAGDVFAVYAMATIHNGAKKAEVLSKDDVEAVRQKSPGKNSPAWKEHWNEMAKKTAFRRLTKWLPLSPEIQNAIAIDDDHEERARRAVEAPAIGMSLDELTNTLEGKSKPADGPALDTSENQDAEPDDALNDPASYEQGELLK